MKNAVMCVVDSRAAAETIVEDLASAGFAGEDISVLFADSAVTSEFAEENATKAPEGAVTGASVGGIIGTAFGFLVGLGALFIPGAGPFLAVGPIVSALSVGAAGAAAGGMTGALIGLGVPESDADALQAKLTGGHLLVSVIAHSADELERAKGIFEAANAEHISSASERDLLV